MPEPVVDPLVGKVLSDRFEIVAPLGAGGMGKVYRALQRPLGREVALKVLNPRYDGTKDPGFERRFFLEASMTAKLKHPNTITVHDYGRTDDGIYFIAMELLEGETLQTILNEQGRLPWQRAVFIAGQIARSLREAHKLGMVHRDLKPANVMLLSEGTGGDAVKVLDFGLVKSFTPEHQEESDADRLGLTQAGVLLGSPLYMAPEQARGEADPRTDLYALGALLFQLISGRPPFMAKESIDVIVKHIRERPPELRSLVTSVPLEVNALVMKCLEKEPQARFQTMDELLDALRLATAGSGLSGAFADPRGAARAVALSNAEVATPSYTDAESIRSLEIQLSQVAETQTGRRRLPLFIAVAIVVLLGGGVGGVVAWRAHSSPDAVQPLPPVATPKPPTDVVVVPTVVTPALPVEVQFDITSDPEGAEVEQDGKSLGVTPLTLKVPRPSATAVQVALSFSLDGYEPGTVVAQGLDGVVSVRHALVPKAVEAGNPRGKPKNPKPPRTTKPKPPEGYKDDPY